MRGSRSQPNGIHPLGDFPKQALIEISKHLVHTLAIGRKDISGDDFGSIFADAVGGQHRASPVGIIDIFKNNCAWSVKTVKLKKPFSKRSIRLISGRNSPIFSSGIGDLFDDVDDTGNSVLSIWNARVSDARRQFGDLRVAVLIRCMESREFVLFEEEISRFIPGDYSWALNKRKNFEGYDRGDGKHRFTWQPHGSQFTIIRHVPKSSKRFKIAHDIPVISTSSVLDAINFSEDWLQ